MTRRGRMAERFLTAAAGTAIFAFLQMMRTLPVAAEPQTPTGKDQADCITLQIPAGTILPVRVNHGIFPNGSKLGEVITARIMQDVPLAGGRKIHAGTTIKGEIIATGRLSVIRMSHMEFALLSLLSKNLSSWPRGPQHIQKGLQVSLHTGQTEQAAPYVQSRERIIPFRLSEKPLGIGNFHEGRETCVVARP